MKPTGEGIERFLEGVSSARREEAHMLTAIMQKITNEKPAMWGPSIIGFGTTHYRYDSGHEGDMPVLSFSPTKASITVYFEGFDNYGEMLEKLGKHQISRACLYINKLADVDLNVLRDMLQLLYTSYEKPRASPTTVEDYVASIPAPARTTFDALRNLIQGVLPHAEEVLSYGILGYKIDDKRPRVYISGWRDHVSMYPVPKNEDLQNRLKPYVKGKGTIWFKPDETLPETLIEDVAQALAST